MTSDEMLSLCARIRDYHDQGMMGALALVATAEQTMVFARLLGALASAKRPIRVFTSPRQARNWIEDPGQGTCGALKRSCLAERATSGSGRP